MNLDELERLAKAATPGPWCSESRDGCPVYLTQCATDAAYLAALSPERVIALLKVIWAADAAFGNGAAVDPHNFEPRDRAYCAAREELEKMP